MNRSKLFVVLFFVIFLSSFASAYLSSNYGQFNNVGGLGSFGTSDSLRFDAESCEAGDDFLIQMSAFGCEPALVRSDLLENQDIPVFCQLSATQINPLISVEAIRSMQINGKGSEGVRGITYTPAKSALGYAGSLNSGEINTPFEDNLGYVTVILKQQPNESALKNCEDVAGGIGEVCYVEGNVTATLKYDVENAFGVGSASFYLPVLSDSEFNNRINQYSFWEGRGYLRAEAVDEGGATISLYADDQVNVGLGANRDYTNLRYSTVYLDEGETSNKIYLPGFDSCLANFQLRLNDVVNPDTRARLKVNGDYVEVSEGEYFLDNKCQLKDLNKDGLVQEVKIRCSDDDKSGNFDLRISPRIELKIGEGDDEIRANYEIGDRLYVGSEGEKSVYLGYIGSKTGGEELEDLYVVLVALPTQKNKLDEDEISSVVSHAERIYESSDTGASVFDGVKKALEFSADMIISGGKYVIEGEQFRFVDYDKTGISSEDFYGDSAEIINYASGGDDVFVSVVDEEYELGEKESVSFVKDIIPILEDGEETNFYLSDTILNSNPSYSLMSNSEGGFKFGKFTPISDDCNSFNTCKNYEFSLTKLNSVEEESEFFDNVVGINLDTEEGKMIVKRLVVQTYGEGEKYKEYYENALEDFENVLNTYSEEEFEDDSGNKITYGEEVLYKSILLANDLNQKNTRKELCSEFLSFYPNSYKSLDVCNSDYDSSSLEISSKEIMVNGDVKRITFEGISEPSFSEYGVELFVKGPNGKSRSFNLRKNKPVSLNGFRDSVQGEGYYITPGSYYLKYNAGWNWSSDGEVWMSVSEVEVSSGNNKGQVAPKTEQAIFKKLVGKNSNEGVLILKGEDVEKVISASGEEFVELVEIIDEDSARVKRYISGSDFWEGAFKSDIVTLDLDEIDGYNGYSFTLENVNLKKSAKVSVLPNINYQESESEFSFKVGIEKRSFPLTPEKAQEKIDALDNSIEDWDKAYDALDKVTTGLKSACLATGAGLVTKNFLANAGGKAIARQKVMRGDSGWTSFCESEISSGKYGGSMDKCFLENADKIDNEVAIYTSVLENQDAKINQIQDEFTSDNVLWDKQVDTEAFVGKYSPTVSKDLANDLSKYEKFEDINLEDMETNLGVDGYNKNYDLEELREIEFYRNVLEEDLSPEARKRAEDNLYSVLKDVEENSGNYIIRKGIADKYGVDEIHFGFDEDVKQVDFTQDLTFGKIKDRFSNSGVIDDNALVQIYVKDNVEHIVLLSSDNIVQETYVVEGDKLQIKNEEDINPLNLKFVKYDKSSYQNEYKASAGETEPVARYFETQPYKGDPAVVPFDTKNGWYAATKQTLATGNNIQSYDDSGVVRSFYLCNVGANGLEEYMGGDDICQLYSMRENNDRTQFYGLNPSETLDLVNRGQRAIEEASKAYARGGTSLRISGVSKPLRIGEPAVDVPAVQCQDFMSPKECNLLFNLCDPVICPSSRCDLGGKYPVQDVIQSGIVGSIALCLPNAQEGIVMPVCLSGIQAGIDGWNSVQKSYRSCLQENIDTGQTVGICDEIHSQYACDFFWRQSLPLVQVAIPKILGFAAGENVRGGGEYLGIQSAWRNAGDSLNYFKQYYAENAYNAFKLRSTQEVGGAVCGAFASATYPDSASLIDSLTEADSPAQYYGNFESFELSTVTNPPISQYNVFYHIYSGRDRGAYYKVYLKGEGGSFYQDTGFDRVVDSGYIGVGESYSDKKEFTAPTGYSQLCIVVNGEEECGFSQVTTSLAIDYAQENYVADIGSETGITTSGDCVSGTSNVLSLFSTNLQSGLEDVIDPQIYNLGITRTCATDNPGVGTDTFAETEKSRWVDVGYCDDKNIRCWLDTDSLKDVLKFTDLEEQAVDDAGKEYIDSLIEEGDYLSDSEYAKKISEIGDKESVLEKVEFINGFIGSVFYSYQQAHLHFLRGQFYAVLARDGYEEVSSLKTLSPTGVDDFDTEVCKIVYGFDNICDLDDARKQALKAAELLEGNLAYSDKAGCFDALGYVYQKAQLYPIGSGSNCVYVDEKGTKYTTNGVEISIGESKNSAGQIIFNVPGPHACSYNTEVFDMAEGIDMAEGKKITEEMKLDKIQSGDFLSIVYDKNYGHNVMFIEWINRDEKRARVFDWSGKYYDIGDVTDEGETCGEDSDFYRWSTSRGANWCSTYGYHEIYLGDDGDNPVFMFWSPVSSCSESGGLGSSDGGVSGSEGEYGSDYVSPEFVFEDGRALVRNINYKFSKGKWYWFDRYQDSWRWVGVDLEDDYLVEKNMDFLEDLKSDESYLGGVTKLIYRALDDNEGGIVNPDLSLEDGTVNMDHEGIFEVSEGTLNSVKVYFKFENGEWYFNPLEIDAKNEGNSWFEVSEVSFDKDSKKIFYGGEEKVSGLEISEKVGDLISDLEGADSREQGALFIFGIFFDGSASQSLDSTLSDSGSSQTPSSSTSTEDKTVEPFFPYDEPVSVDIARELVLKSARDLEGESVSGIEDVYDKARFGIGVIVSENTCAYSSGIAYDCSIECQGCPRAERDFREGDLLLLVDGNSGKDFGFVFEKWVSRENNLISGWQLSGNTLRYNPGYSLSGGEVLAISEPVNPTSQDWRSVSGALAYMNKELRVYDANGKFFSGERAHFMYSDYADFVDQIYYEGFLTYKQYKDIIGKGLFNDDEDLVFVREKVLENVQSSWIDYCGSSVYKYELDSFNEFLKDNGLSTSADYCSNVRISNTDKHFTEIRFPGRNIKDVSALSGLNEVYLINLESNSIEDISGLEKIEALESLTLDNNKIVDIPDFTTHKNLRSLYLDGNQIVDSVELAESLPINSFTNLHRKLDTISIRNNCIDKNVEILRNGMSRVSENYLVSGNPRIDCGSLETSTTPKTVIKVLDSASNSVSNSKVVAESKEVEVDSSTEFKEVSFKADKIVVSEPDSSVVVCDTSCIKVPEVSENVFDLESVAPLKVNNVKVRIPESSTEDSVIVSAKKEAVIDSSGEIEIEEFDVFDLVVVEDSLGDPLEGFELEFEFEDSNEVYTLITDEKGEVDLGSSNSLLKNLYSSYTDLIDNQFISGRDSVLIVDGDNQKMYLVVGNSFLNGYPSSVSIRRTYLVSTALNGFGETESSLKTPRGVHILETFVGSGADSRLPLDGQQFFNLNTFSRGIYIQKASVESSVGSAVTQGDIEMKEDDFLDLISLVEPGTRVYIKLSLDNDFYG